MPSVGRAALERQAQPMTIDTIENEIYTMPEDLPSIAQAEPLRPPNHGSGGLHKITPVNVKIVLPSLKEITSTSQPATSIEQGNREENALLQSMSEKDTTFQKNAGKTSKQKPVQVHSKRGEQNKATERSTSHALADKGQLDEDNDSYVVMESGHSALSSETVGLGVPSEREMLANTSILPPPDRHMFSQAVKLKQKSVSMLDLKAKGFQLSRGTCHGVEENLSSKQHCPEHDTTRGSLNTLLANTTSGQDLGNCDIESDGNHTTEKTAGKKHRDRSLANRGLFRSEIDISKRRSKEHGSKEDAAMVHGASSGLLSATTITFGQSALGRHSHTDISVASQTTSTEDIDEYEDMDIHSYEEIPEDIQPTFARKRRKRVYREEWTLIAPSSKQRRNTEESVREKEATKNKRNTTAEDRGIEIIEHVESSPPAMAKMPVPSSSSPHTKFMAPSPIRIKKGDISHPIPALVGQESQLVKEKSKDEVRKPSKRRPPPKVPTLTNEKPSLAVQENATSSVKKALPVSYSHTIPVKKCDGSVEQHKAKPPILPKKPVKQVPTKSTDGVSKKGSRRRPPPKVPHHKSGSQDDLHRNSQESVKRNFQCRSASVDCLLEGLENPENPYMPLITLEQNVIPSEYAQMQY